MSPPTATNDFKTRDAASYDPLVEPFDAFASRFCAPFAEHIVTLSAVAPTDRVLDVGCGTGIVALRVAPVVPRGQILGVDLSDGMLQTARTKATRAGFHHVGFQKMDAEALHLEDQSFDAVLSLFALTHFPDPLTALNEMYRVLVPGGRLVLGVGGGPLLLSRAGVGAGLRRIQRGWLEWRGQQLTAPHFLDGLTLKHLGDGGEPEETAWAGKLARAAHVCRLVTEAGFHDSAVDWQEQVVVLTTLAEFWEIQATWSSIARKRLRGASTEMLDALRDEFDRTCDAVLSRGGRLVYPLAAFYVRARRP